MSCKDCEHYEFYDGPNLSFLGKKAVMKCSNTELNPPFYAHATNRCHKYFTPKKPKEERTCGNCKKSLPPRGPAKTYITPHVYCPQDMRHYAKDWARTFACWQPIEKPGQATMLPDVPISQLLCKEIPEFLKPPKQKETKMWNKLRKRARRITMAWDIFGIFLLCRLVNPYVCKLWQVITKGNEGFWDDCQSVVGVSWFFTIASALAIIAACYALDRAAAWYYGEK